MNLLAVSQSSSVGMYEDHLKNFCFNPSNTSIFSGFSCPNKGTYVFEKLPYLLNFSVPEQCQEFNIRSVYKGDYLRNQFVWRRTEDNNLWAKFNTTPAFPEGEGCHLHKCNLSSTRSFVYGPSDKVGIQYNYFEFASACRHQENKCYIEKDQMKNVCKDLFLELGIVGGTSVCLFLGFLGACTACYGSCMYYEADEEKRQKWDQKIRELCCCCCPRTDVP